MAAEDILCLLLARGTLPPELRKQASDLLANPLRWDRLLDRAKEHQVFPLVYRNLRDLGFSGVPEPIRAELAAAFRANALRNTFLAQELARVLYLLGEVGIPVIPLKGVTLAESLFGDSALRVCSDIDILVPATAVVRARRLLVAEGYTSPFAEEFFVKHQLQTSADCSLLARGNHLEYLLEIHWTLLQHSSKDTEVMQDLWAQARLKRFLGIHAYALSAEWQFLYLAGHAAYHKWHTLKWLADIHELCVSASIDWSAVNEKAERFDLDSAVAPTLTACSLLFGTRILPGLCHRPMPTGVRLFPDSLAPSEAWKAPLFYPRLLKRPSEKLRWFAEMLFVARLADRSFFHLPDSLSILYYVLRPIRLACKWSWLFLSAVFRGGL